MTAVILLLASLTFIGYPPARTVYPNVRQPTPSAYFVFQATDLDETPWPDRYWPYTVMVCNGSMMETGLRRLDARLPNVTKLAYTDAQNIEVANSRSGSAYWDSLETRFATAFGTDSTICIRDLTTGEALRMDPPDAHPSWIPFKASVDVWAQFHTDFTIGDNADWDGMYLDDCTAVYPAWRQALLQDVLNAGHTFDCNGDGAPDTIAQAVAQWATWRPYMTQKLRAVVGSDKVLIANAGGALNDPVVNGICIEGVGHTVTESNAIAAFQAQRAVSVDPFVSVAWVTQASTDDIPSMHMVQQVPGVYYGVVVP